MKKIVFNVCIFFPAESSLLSGPVKSDASSKTLSIVHISESDNGNPQYNQTQTNKYFEDDQNSSQDDQNSSLDDQNSRQNYQNSSLDDQNSPQDDQNSSLDDQNLPQDDQNSAQDDQSSSQENALSQTQASTSVHTPRIAEAIFDLNFLDDLNEFLLPEHSFGNNGIQTPSIMDVVKNQGLEIPPVQRSSPKCKRNIKYPERTIFKQDIKKSVIKGTCFRSVMPEFRL